MTAIENTTAAFYYQGWETYQQLLIKAIAPLSAEQLALRPAPHLRSIGMTVTHIIGARVRWLHDLLQEGDEELAALGKWDRKDMPERTAAELVQGLETSWAVLKDALARWTRTDMEFVFYESWQGEEYALSRQWVIWHLIEHDLHHGGELSITLGIHQLAAPDL